MCRSATVLSSYINRNLTDHFINLTCFRKLQSLPLALEEIARACPWPWKKSLVAMWQPAASRHPTVHDPCNCKVASIVGLKNRLITPAVAWQPAVLAHQADIYIYRNLYMYIQDDMIISYHLAFYADLYVYRATSSTQLQQQGPLSQCRPAHTTGSAHP